jgi:hypothetical protein
LLLDPLAEESFVWLFVSWLRAMHSKQPVTVITDPNLVVINAIKTVFPNTRHRLSIWHMKRKFKAPGVFRIERQANYQGGVPEACY